MPVRPSGESALRSISSPRQFTRVLSQAHERFVTGQTTHALDVRQLVLDSWNRCANHGVDPSAPEAPVVLTSQTLAAAKSTSPLNGVIELIRSLLTESAADSGNVVAVGDQTGRLLWVEGDRRMLQQAEAMGFLEGAHWSEEVAGTNAPGTALALDAPVQIASAEHFLGVAQPWSCVAVPVHDPVTGATIGVVDVTGGDAVATNQSLALVRATVAAAERELLVRHRDAGGTSAAVIPAQRGKPWQLEVLGRDRAILVRGGQRLQLSARHSELVLLLATFKEGLTAERMAVLLSDEEIPAVTIRAEMTRLRRILGPAALSSRPYRLTVEISTDAAEIGDALDRGSLRKALRAYTGALMPASDAPAIAELRASLHSRARRAALTTTDAESILAYASTESGSEDAEILRAALRALPARSPRRSSLIARLDSVDAAFG